MMQKKNLHMSFSYPSLQSPGFRLRDRSGKPATRNERGLAAYRRGQPQIFEIFFWQSPVVRQICISFPVAMISGAVEASLWQGLLKKIPDFQAEY